MGLDCPDTQVVAHLIAVEDTRSAQQVTGTAQVQGAVPDQARMAGSQVGQCPGVQARTEEERIDFDSDDHGLATRAAHPVLNLADDLADVDEEQDLITGADVSGDVRGEQVDAPVGQEPTAQPAE